MLIRPCRLSATAWLPGVANIVALPFWRRPVPARPSHMPSFRCRLDRRRPVSPDGRRVVATPPETAMADAVTGPARLQRLAYRPATDADNVAWQPADGQERLVVAIA